MAHKIFVVEEQTQLCNLIKFGCYIFPGDKTKEKILSTKEREEFYAEVSIYQKSYGELVL